MESNTLHHVTAKPKGRRVTFDGWNSEEEEERSCRGIASRKRKKETRREKMEAALRENSSESKVTDADMQVSYQILLNERNHKRLVKLYNRECEHPDVDEISLVEFQSYFTSFLAAAGTSTKDDVGSQLKWLRTRERKYEELIARTNLKGFLAGLSRNYCFRIHFKFVSEPPSSSETSLAGGPIEKHDTFIKQFLKPDEFPGEAEIGKIVRHRGFLTLSQSRSEEKDANEPRGEEDEGERATNSENAKRSVVDHANGGWPIKDAARKKQKK